MKKSNYIFFVLGTIAIVCAIGIVIRDVYFIKKAIEVEATVAECKVEYNGSGSSRSRDVAVYVDYIYNGKEYNHVLVEQRKEKEHKKNSVITIYINPSSPSEPLTDSSFLVWIKIIVCGMVFFSIGILILVLERKSKRQKEFLMENGITVYAKLRNIYKKNKNADSPLVLRCTYCDENNRDHTYVSEGAYNDLTKCFCEGEMIEVKVMPNDYSKYYIDLEGLWEKKTRGYKLNQ